MRFLFDHDGPDDLSHVLRQLQHAVILLREVLPRTATDPEILSYAAAHDLIVVTCNRADFVALAQATPPSRLDCALPSQEPHRRTRGARAFA